MAIETRVSYNSDSSEFVSVQPIIYELLSRLANSVEENRVRATGRSLVRSDETLGLIDELMRELPKVTSLSDQIVTKRDQMLNDAEEFMQSSRADAMRESKEIRQRAEEERDIILTQARKKAMETIAQTSVVNASQEEARRIIQEAEGEAEKVLIRAKREANTIVESAADRSHRQTNETDEYSRRMLMKLEERLSHTLMQVRQGIDMVNESVEERQKQHARETAMQAAKFNVHNTNR
jgi:cell division septum initiation protein DivIVA